MAGYSLSGFQENVRVSNAALEMRESVVVMTDGTGAACLTLLPKRARNERGGEP